MFIEIHVANLSEIIYAGVSLLVIFGHNLWLVGKNEQKRIRIEANTGDHFPESDSAVKPERVADFRVISSDGFTPITDYRVEENSLVADVPIENDKSFCVALALHAHPITLEAVKFAGYIKEESAEEFVKPNFILEDTIEPQRESYTKFAKVLVKSGAAQTDNISDLIAGHKLEIIPQIPTSGIGDDRMLPVQVLFEGKPIEGLRVSSGSEGLNDGRYLSHALTDENGMANVVIPESGHWFARTHFIRPHLDNQNFDWESCWASVTFRT
jgi:uncharacterized GH25 family protein